MPHLYAIIDLPHPHGLALAPRFAALREGAGPRGLALCQLRFKSGTSTERHAAAAELGPLCLAADVPLIVNDDVDLALAGIPGIGGVHLGQGDPGFDDTEQVRARARSAGQAGFRVGISTHDTAQLRAAIAQRPDYVAYGPVCATRSKQDADPVVGFDGLADGCRIAHVPVVAIGGMDPRAAARAIAVGASMVAVIGGLVATTPSATAAAARAYVDAIADAARPLTVAEVHARIPVISAATLAEIARWSDDLSVLAGLRLPTRFSPRFDNGVALYRPSDVVDLLAAIGKRDSETWDEWRARGDVSDASIVLLRRNT